MAVFQYHLQCKYLVRVHNREPDLDISITELPVLCLTLPISFCLFCDLHSRYIISPIDEESMKMPEREEVFIENLRDS